MRVGPQVAFTMYPLHLWLSGDEQKAPIVATLTDHVTENRTWAGWSLYNAAASSENDRTAW